VCVCVCVYVCVCVCVCVCYKHGIPPEVRVMYSFSGLFNILQTRDCEICSS